jgi:streptomycin 6-kinase
LNLPQDFVTTIQNAFGEDGRAWLAALPDLIDAASRQWGLTNVQPVSNLSYNYVAFALRSPGILPGRVNQSTLGRSVVLKIGVPNHELTSEINALRSFDGKGAVRLLEADEKRAMFLLERLRPGEMLATLTDDDRATQIAADVMLNLWCPPPTKGAFIKLSDWFKGLEKLRRRFRGGTGPFEKSLIERAEHSVANFFNESYVPMLIHGDLHHYNILSSDHGWLVIDPKGVIGPAAYEVGPLLMNPLGFLNQFDAIQITKRRISILAERLGFERERIREWGIAHAVLSAWWDLEDNMDWGYAMHCAEVIAQA